MSPIIPKLHDESRNDVRSFVSKEYVRRELVLAGSPWQNYKAYAGRSLAPFVTGLMTLSAYMTNAPGQTFNELIIRGIVYAVTAGAIAYLVYVPIACYIAIFLEKRKWNGGICADTREPWKADGRDWDTDALRFIAETDYPVCRAGSSYFSIPPFQYHHTLHLTYTRPATEADAIATVDKPIRREHSETRTRSLPVSLWAAAVVIIGSFWAIYWLAGLYSIIALSLVISAALYVVCKIADNTEFGSWTIVMCSQLYVFGVWGVDPGMHMSGAGNFMLGFLGLALVAIIGLVAADK